MAKPTKAIINIWVTSVIEGRRDFTRVPPQLKEAVAEELRARGRDDLIIEEAEE